MARDNAFYIRVAPSVEIDIETVPFDTRYLEDLKNLKPPLSSKDYAKIDAFMAWLFVAGSSEEVKEHLSDVLTILDSPILKDYIMANVSRPIQGVRHVLKYTAGPLQKKFLCVLFERAGIVPDCCKGILKRSSLPALLSGNFPKFESICKALRSRRWEKVKETGSLKRSLGFYAYRGWLDLCDLYDIYTEEDNRARHDKFLRLYENAKGFPDDTTLLTLYLYADFNGFGAEDLREIVEERLKIKKGGGDGDRKETAKDGTEGSGEDKEDKTEERNIFKKLWPECYDAIHKKWKDSGSIKALRDTGWKEIYDCPVAWQIFLIAKAFLRDNLWLNFNYDGEVTLMKGSRPAKSQDLENWREMPKMVAAYVIASFFSKDGDFHKGPDPAFFIRTDKPPFSFDDRYGSSNEKIFNILISIAPLVKALKERAKNENKLMENLRRTYISRAKGPLNPILNNLDMCARYGRCLENEGEWADPLRDWMGKLRKEYFKFLKGKSVSLDLLTEEEWERAMEILGCGG